MHLLILSSPKFHHCPTIFLSFLPSTDLYTYRASNSHSGNSFCISDKWMSESPPFCRRLSCLRGFHSMRYSEMTKGCYTRSVSKSCFEPGLCNSIKRVSGFLSVCTDNGNLSGIKCEGGFVEERGDNFYMRRCVELARKAAGCTSPNPMVGCVIVKNGEIVGEGFHPKAGQPHAEVFALKDAGTHAENATAYVSLEPCNHHGRTPPCTEALIQAKVKQVIVGMVDPNPIVASKGVERLKEAGIEVTVGVEEELCQKLNEAYIHRMLTGKPFVTLRYSLSFNGQILSQISKGDEGSSGYYLQLLQEHDGVIISSTSVSSDTDFSTFHLSRAKQPLLIIVTTASDPPLHLPSLTEEVAQHTVIFTDKDTIVDPVTKSNLGRWGTEIVVLDQVNLNPITDYCRRHGLCSILMDFREDCSSFHEILQRGLEEGLFQKVVMEVCPLWAGRKENPFVELKSIEKKPVKLKDLQSRVLKGGSVLVEGYLC